jgi:hypothetical protein
MHTLSHSVHNSRPGLILSNVTEGTTLVIGRWVPRTPLQSTPYFLYSDFYTLYRLYPCIHKGLAFAEGPFLGYTYVCRSISLPPKD